MMLWSEKKLHGEKSVWGICSYFGTPSIWSRIQPFLLYTSEMYVKRRSARV